MLSRNLRSREESAGRTNPSLTNTYMNFKSSHKEEVVVANNVGMCVSAEW